MIVTLSQKFGFLRSDVEILYQHSFHGDVSSIECASENQSSVTSVSNKFVGINNQSSQSNDWIGNLGGISGYSLDIWFQTSFLILAHLLCVTHGIVNGRR